MATEQADLIYSLPTPDRDSTPWWDALRRHELILQRCNQCGRWRWPARSICGNCGSFEWDWHEVLHTGTVVSWVTTVHRFLPQYEGGPYSTVLVQLHITTDGDQTDIVIPGSWVHPDPPFTGQAVTARFVDFEIDGEAGTVLGWVPA